jgi:hypothetical protein
MCGCRKNSSNRATSAFRPNSTRAVAGTVTTLSQARAQQPQSPVAPLNSGGLNAERRKTQALRRDAIRKSFNR